MDRRRRLICRLSDWCGFPGIKPPFGVNYLVRSPIHCTCWRLDCTIRIVNGKRTAVVLGAGASHCYDDGTGPLPLQAEIVGNLVRISASSGGAPPEVAGPAGLSHSPRLERALLDHLGMASHAASIPDSFAVWEKLRARGENLETVYGRLDASLMGQERDLLADFAAILRSSVRQPVPIPRGVEAVCRHHRALAEALDPGDYIITFNWDSLMADALIHFCPFWYPSTGLGLPRVRCMTTLRQKGMPVESLVQLIPIHGSVLLLELLSGDLDSEGTGQFLYLGPPGFGVGSGMMALFGPNPGSQGSIPFDERKVWAVNRDYLYFQDRWFRPVFVPPSLGKGEYSHPYHRALRTLVHTLLPQTEQFVVVGYSFPPADAAHLRRLFEPGVIRSDAEAVVVNPSCRDPAYQAMAKECFPSILQWDFARPDFREFARGLGGNPR